jgi:hypothetical protein
MFVPWRPPDDRSSAYLLGAYLGDGVALLEEHVGPKA